MTQQNKTNEFLRRHGVRVLDTNKRAYRHTKANIQLFAYEDDYNKFNSDHFVFETETLYTVEITESELERLAGFEEQVFNHMSSKGHYNMFETLMEQKEEEQHLKNTYPAVKKAYEHYSLLLKMAKSGDI
jgi:hypothetical protein